MRSSSFRSFKVKADVLISIRRIFILFTGTIICLLTFCPFPPGANEVREGTCNSEWTEVEAFYPLCHELSLQQTFIKLFGFLVFRARHLTVVQAPEITTCHKKCCLRTRSVYSTEKVSARKKQQAYIPVQQLWSFDHLLLVPPLICIV